MIETKIQSALVQRTFRGVDRLTAIYHRLSLLVISTGRSFGYYRSIFFGGKSAPAVLGELRGKRILDIGCGLTPYVSNSMFQACHKAGIDFYGIDPKLEQGFRLGAFDRAKIRATGGGKMRADAPGLERAIATAADQLPFEDESVDLILSSYLLFAWIRDEALLDSIFREFDRVLTPGGETRIFPAPHYAPGKIVHPGLQQRMRGFDVQQTFFSGLLPRTRFPPAYMRSLRKHG